MASCKCGGGQCNCVVVAGSNTTVTGAGSAANPYVVSAAAPVTGCGLTGAGSAANPLKANTAAWGYACDMLDNAENVYCDENGQLRGEPRRHIAMRSFFFGQDYNNVRVPAARDQLQARIESQFTNPDPCRQAFMVVERELEFELTFPPGSGAEYGMDGPDQMVRHFNNSSTTETGWHMQVTKVLSGGVADPGETVTVGFDALAGLGTGGAAYTHIQGILRVLFISI